MNKRLLQYHSEEYALQKQILSPAIYGGAQCAAGLSVQQSKRGQRPYLLVIIIMVTFRYTNKSSR